MAKKDQGATPTPTSTGSGAKPAPSSAPDWERIELDYRAGIKPLRQLASEHGISEGAIRKRAKRDDWSRDLSDRIQQKADELVRKSEVRKQVRTETATEREVIASNAQAIANVRLSHRTDIQRARSITMRLLEELECQTGAENVWLLEKLGELLRDEDDFGRDRLNDLYQKIISLPGRAKTMKDLGESLRVLVAMERQAFGLDDKDNAPVDALTSLLARVSSGTDNGFKPVARDPEHDED